MLIRSKGPKNTGAISADSLQFQT